MVTVKTDQEAREYFHKHHGLSLNAPIVVIEATLPAEWDSIEVVNGKRIAHLSKQAC